MKYGIGFPYEAFGQAMGSFLGRFGIVLTTTLVGFWLGYCVRYGKVFGPRVTIVEFSFVFTIHVLLPLMNAPVFTILLACLLPRWIENVWLQWAAVLLNFLAWFAFTAWIFLVV
jgi:hypothetical protein